MARPEEPEVVRPRRVPPWRPAPLALSVALVVVAASCGATTRSAAPTSRARGSAPPSATSLPGLPPAPASSTLPPATTVPTTSAPPAPTTSAPPAPTGGSNPSLPPPGQLVGVGGASRVVEVVGAGWSSMVATMALWERQPAGTWVLARAPLPVYVGKNGWAEPSQEHEGGPPTTIPMTLRTPVGAYGFGTGFGWGPDPGYGGPWLDVAPDGNPLGHPDTYWDESPGTPDYNAPSPTPTAPWNENLTTTPQYDQAALIDYNTPGPSQIPDRGSGIFLHDDPPGYTYTAGCVAVPGGLIGTVLHFIDTADTVIVMGPASAITAPAAS